MNGQTSIIGSNSVDIRTEKNTHVEGAVIAAENGNLKLDTGTLTYKDLQDKDTGSNTQVGVSVPLGSALGASASPAKGDSSPVGDFLMGSTLSGSYDSHDREQINRATIGAGTIIIRSDPSQGLAGLNRDLARAQELTKNSETSVTVYIDVAAIKEVAGGLKGIRDGYDKIVELVKKALPEDAVRMKNSIDNQLSMRNELLNSGLPATKVDEVLGKYGKQADLKNEIDKEVSAKGGWDNISEEDALGIISQLRFDTRVVQLRAGGRDIDGNEVDISIENAKLFLNATLQTAKNMGLSSVDTLNYLNGACSTVFNVATLGKMYANEAKEFRETNNKIADAVTIILQNPQGASQAFVNTLQKDWNKYVDAIEAGDADAAAKHLGNVGSSLLTAVLTVEGLSSSALTKLESKVPGFVANLKAAQEITRTQTLVAELKANGVNFTSENVLKIEKLADGRIVWLESGNEKAGLAHIVTKHAGEFLGRGITADQIPDAIMTAVKEGKIIGYQGKGTDRPIYEFAFNGKAQQVAITVSSNGYIVGANPTRGK